MQTSTQPATPGDYIKSLPAWDGTHRLSTWLAQVFKRETATELPTEERERLARIGTIFIECMVSRALPQETSGPSITQGPGVSISGMPVLAGDSGSGKSTALKVLAGKFFSDAVQDICSTQIYDELQKCWLLEIAELQALDLAAQKALGDLAHKSADTWRPAYQSHVQTLPRLGLIAASTNSEICEDEWSRRFWFVSCTKPADIEWLQANRDQLFAEGLANIERRAAPSEPVVLTRDAAQQAFALWERRYRDDPSEFMTQEEVKAMAVADLSERAAIYFFALLREVSE